MKRLIKAVYHNENEITTDYLKAAKACGKYFAEHLDEFNEYLKNLEFNVISDFNDAYDNYKEKENIEPSRSALISLADEAARKADAYYNYLEAELIPVIKDTLTEEKFNELQKEDSSLVTNIFKIMQEHSIDYQNAIKDVKDEIVDKLLS